METDTETDVMTTICRDNNAISNAVNSERMHGQQNFTITVSKGQHTIIKPKKNNSSTAFLSNPATYRHKRQFFLDFQ